MSKDKAGKVYWDQLWTDQSLPRAVDPRMEGPHNYAVRRWHEIFCQALPISDAGDRRLLEIGCARSAWLPYSANEFGFEVSGLDYSETGCQQARQILYNEGVEGEVILANFFSPPHYMLETFDVVVSFGVVEHFEDTARVLDAFSSFLRPGGLIVTIVPNMLGVVGFVQRVIDRSVYEMHVPLDRDSLAEAHQSSAFEVVSCNYFLFANPGVINIENWRSAPFYKIATRVQSLISRLMWICEEAMRSSKPGRQTSSYVICIAKKQCA